jgi:hypothetical protein
MNILLATFVHEYVVENKEGALPLNTSNFKPTGPFSKIIPPRQEHPGPPFNHIRRGSSFGLFSDLMK